MGFINYEEEVGTIRFLLDKLSVEVLSMGFIEM